MEVAGQLQYKQLEGNGRAIHVHDDRNLRNNTILSYRTHGHAKIKKQRIFHVTIFEITKSSFNLLGVVFCGAENRFFVCFSIWTSLSIAQPEPERLENSFGSGRVHIFGKFAPIPPEPEIKLLGIEPACTIYFWGRSGFGRT